MASSDFNLHEPINNVNITWESGWTPETLEFASDKTEAGIFSLNFAAIYPAGKEMKANVPIKIGTMSGVTIPGARRYMCHATSYPAYAPTTVIPCVVTVTNDGSLYVTAQASTASIGKVCLLVDLCTIL